MNKDMFQGQWKQLKGRVRQQWGKLTDDDIDKIQGNVEMLNGRLQERYGRAKDVIQKEVHDWLEKQPSEAGKVEKSIGKA